MADARARGDAGNGGGAQTGVDEPRAPPGDQQVNIAVRGHQGCGAGAGGVLHQVHGGFRDALPGQSLPKSLHNGVCAAEGLLAAPEDADVAAFQGQGGGVAGDVGTAFINDGNDPHGDGHLADVQTVGPGVLLQDFSHRVREGGHLPDAPCHGGDPVGGQTEPVQHHRGDGACRGLQIPGVGGEDGLLVGGEGLCHGKQGGVLFFTGQIADLCLGGLRVFKHGFHRRSSVNNVPTGRPSRMS